MNFVEKYIYNTKIVLFLTIILTVSSFISLCRCWIIFLGIITAWVVFKASKQTNNEAKQTKDELYQTKNELKLAAHKNDFEISCYMGTYV